MNNLIIKIDYFIRNQWCSRIQNNSRTQWIRIQTWQYSRRLKSFTCLVKILNTKFFQIQAVKF